MGQIHDKCRLHQSTVRIPQPLLGEVKAGRGMGGSASCVHCVSLLFRISILSVVDTHRLSQLALVQWKEHFFLYIQGKHSKLSGAILRLIERERNGETIDQDLVKKVVGAFVLLGLNEEDINKVSLNVYKEHLEAPFLDAMEKYYEQDSEPFIAENRVSDYLKKAEERLKNEEDRINRYLNTETRKKLRLCALLSRVPNGLEPLRKRFEEHVKNAGLATVAKLLGEDAEGADSLDPKAYVDALLEVHRKNSETVTKSFRGEVGFVVSLDKARREFVNRNAATGSSMTRSPELLAKHADMLLRKNNEMAGEDLEGALNRMVLFNYVEGKDVFQTFYAIKLSRRLIHGVSMSHESSEVSMISKLKVTCGFEYANKLQRMFTDMTISEDLADQFKERVQNHDDMDINFSIVVLGTNIWPLSPPNNDFIIPPEILSTYDSFTKFYGTNVLKYILMTSSYQMAVLLQYNKHDTLSLEELISAAAIGKDILSQVLAPLVKAKVLINETEQYSLNPNFKSKKIRVNLNQPIKTEVKAESSEVLKTVDDDRKYVIQTTIIRIMKTRKTMKNQPLIQEVISKISQRFVPKIPDIKKAIETLSEKEYIERMDGDTFVYVA
ncbi:Cullin-domain-containing protein [Rhizopogon vinicolor AM-OR11-026]|uniref:Cullin-domain-containing protein n=1 Tax=Rhizopogon vinicolor AM-OR11-026 TaxID=1314800 RepID=A0A1B7MII0_9AGAM|nr:Cullin-domain-containing protein [Rhizopogon vinicolor AM-OR11-026]